MIEINGLTRTCGLIGNPVEHTLSPMIHNYLAQQMDVNMVYVPFLVEQGRLEDAIKGAYGLHILGCNVTVPYKNDVIPYLAQIDEFKMAKQWQIQMSNGGLAIEKDGLIMSVDSRINKCIENIKKAEYIFKSKYGDKRL